MLKRTNSASVSAGAKTKRRLDTAGECSSADAENEHLFLHTESTNASTEAVNGNPTLDTEDLDIPDSLTLARVDRENQGPCEAEYSYGGEADLHRYYDSCPKNPGHKDFIPVDTFSIDHLPKSYRHTEIVDYIRALADLTVRVSVHYVSDRRPATAPDSGQPYPGYGNRGHMRMTVGTGWVDEVKIKRDRQKTCECKDCRNSSRPEIQFAVISIATANHVVFDDLEAEHTTCHLFFDSGGTPDACSGVVTLTGMKSKSRNINTDQYYMEHFTHDLHLGYRLLASCNHKDNLMSKLHNILPQITKVSGAWEVTDVQPILLILSHPHGCRKHISIGRWTGIHYTETGELTHEYTAATCPGSSGALVVMPHPFKPSFLHPDSIYVPGAHCGKSDKLPSVNYFKAENLADRMKMLLWDTDYKDGRLMLPRDKRLLDRITKSFRRTDILKMMPWSTQDKDDLEIMKKYFRDEDALEWMRKYFQNEEFKRLQEYTLHGPREENFVYVDEENLHRHDDTSQKNPGHQNCCPIC